MNTAVVELKSSKSSRRVEFQRDANGRLTGASVYTSPVEPKPAKKPREVMTRRMTSVVDANGSETGTWILEDLVPKIHVSMSDPEALAAALGVTPGNPKKFLAELHDRERIDEKFLRGLPDHLHLLAFRAVRDAAEFFGRNAILNDLLRRAWKTARTRLCLHGEEYHPEEIELTERLYALGKEQLRAALRRSPAPV